MHMFRGAAAVAHGEDDGSATADDITAGEHFREGGLHFIFVDDEGSPA